MCFNYRCVLIFEFLKLNVFIEYFRTFDFIYYCCRLCRIRELVKGEM